MIYLKQIFGRFTIMLITYAECGKEISNKSKQCINCGYPLDELPLNNDVDNKVNNGNLSDSKCPMCGVQKVHVIKDNIKETCAVCGYVFNEDYVRNHPELLPVSKCPKGPQCGSTAIFAGADIVDGYSWGTVNRCANCGYEWKPKKKKRSWF